jgi:hypothetical protein
MFCRFNKLHNKIPKKKVSWEGRGGRTQGEMVGNGDEEFQKPVFFWRKIWRNFNLKKNMISTYTKGFFMEKMAQICQISNEKFSKTPDFNVYKIQQEAKSTRKILVFFYFKIR